MSAPHYTDAEKISRLMAWRDADQKEIAKLRRRVAELEGERDEWRRALQSLTPGGSEFTEPQECERYLRTRDNDRWELLKRVKRERDALAHGGKPAGNG